MALAPGTRIGNYEVLTPLGAGGMGEVCRAIDRRLDRSVAIKSLPKALASDSQSLSRFEREAKLLASLDHTNIAGIHGLEEVDGTVYLVLEFIDGETLSARLARGPLPPREAIEVGRQIAAAIEAAHERGIVHRDLKPSNVMITESRNVKVLDFGLARGGAHESATGADLSASPTLAVSATGAGVILGTAPYMSPEQARGKPVDRRADVWAFGCVLFECLSGRQAFSGETVSDVIARILEREPDWAALPASTPARLRDVVRRCLTKDEFERPRDIGDLRRELGAIALEMSAPAAAPQAGTSKPSLAVLYFENVSSDAESEYFCSGITEDILTDLSKIKGLRVASRNAVGRYRGAPVDIARVGAELGVDAVLEGSVRRAGDRVRITAQLINVSDGFHLWAERYDRTLQDVFAVQEEIASSIASALQVALSPSESRNLVQDRPNDVRAYDLYLKGREHYQRFTRDEFQKALDLFQQAISIDPDYALAWAGVADCYGQILQWGTAADADEVTRLGLEAARRSIALNPKLAEGHKALALVLRFSGDLQGSRAALLKALEANPRYTPALTNLAVNDFSDANIASAERLIRRAIDVDPQNQFPRLWLAVICVITGREDAALEIATTMQRMPLDTFYMTATHLTQGWVQVRRHDLAAAQRVVEDARARHAEAGNMRCLEALIAALSGRGEEASRMLSILGEGLGTGALVLGAQAALKVGDRDRALSYLARPVIGDLAPAFVRLDHDLHGLLDRPPFVPRRFDKALVWPLEAPMIDAVRHALFREVRIESAMPEHSEASIRS